MGLSSLGLAGKFAFLGLIIVAAVGLFMHRSLSDTIADQVVEDAVNQSVTLSSVVLSNALSPADLEEPMTDPEVYQEFENFLNENLLTGEVHRVKLWNPEGTIVYSDKKELVGRQFPVKGKLAKALKGLVAGDIVETEQGEHASEQILGKEVVEIYVPLTLKGSSEVAGSYEVYISLNPIRQKIGDLQGRMTNALIGGLVLLFVAMVLIIHGAARSLRHQLGRTSTQVEGSLEELRQLKEKAQRARESENETLHGPIGLVAEADELAGQSTDRVGDLTATISQLEKAQERLADIRKKAL